MVKTAINIKTHIKAKNIEVEEYEKIMNVWRACMLFFERELRKLHDKEELTTETLQKVADKIDFTELLRMNFLSIKDSERMRLVKLTEVAEAIQKVQSLSNQQIQDMAMEESYIQPTTSVDYSEYQTLAGSQEFEQNPQLDVENPIKSILSQNIQNDEDNRPEIRVKDHLRVLQRNTASSVVELRKMMFQNIQKIRQALSDESI